MNIFKIKKYGIVWLIALLGCLTNVYGHNLPNSPENAIPVEVKHCLWMQQPSISPDGKWIAFEYKGNLYKVSSNGGKAIGLTTGNDYTGYPVWSHDGKQIAYATDQNGNFDVYVMPSSGGPSRRLTYSSRRDIPFQFSADDQHVLFLTDRHDIYTSARFPVDVDFKKIFSVPVTGGNSVMVNSAGADFANFNRDDSKLLFEDFKGHENPWRMHQRGPVTKDIWLYNTANQSYQQLTDFNGEDREPVWGDGNSFYYLSERNGSQNIFLSDIRQPSVITQITFFTDNPVRNLSRSDRGTLCFTQNGDLYTLSKSSKPKMLTVQIGKNPATDTLETIAVKGDISEMALSPDGKQIAFVYRGDIFVMSVKDSVTRRITSTPYQERMVQFSPDGRTLLYSVEINGSWNIYQAKITDPKEKYFYNAKKIYIDPVINSHKDEFQGVYSPDGKYIAYLEERNILRVFDIQTKKSVTVLPEGMNYSFTDGDQSFTWSPNSEYLLVTSAEGISNRSNIILVKADGSGERVNLTRSGFNNQNPQWGMNGKMIYYLSDKLGLLNMSGGTQDDVFAMFFTQQDFDKYTAPPQPGSPDKQAAADTTINPKNVANKLAGSAASTISQDFIDHRENRTIQLTENSVFLSAAVLSPDGEKLYLLAQVEGMFDVWEVSPHQHDMKLLAKTNIPGGDLHLSGDGKFLFLLAGGQISKISTETGVTSPLNISTTTTVDHAGERAYILAHTYHLISKKFYDPKLKGINWDYYYAQYQRFLPYINNNYDFTILLSEFEGELDASHTGASYDAPPKPHRDFTGVLGLLYNMADTSAGLKVAEVITGGPFDQRKSNMKKGFIIDSINGSPLKATMDWSLLLNHKYYIDVPIAFHDPVSGKKFSEKVQPIYPGVETYDLLYKRWVHLMEHLTDSLSGGKIGYIHIRSMDEQTLRETIDKTLGQYGDKKAIIFDTRYNPGGNIRAQLASFLESERVLNARPQGHLLSEEGTIQHLNKPTCVLIGEDNYSDAYNFPYLYKANGTGKLVGMPVAGSGVGVWFETQIDPTITIGIPQVGLSLAGNDGQMLENQQLDPDIKVRNDYSELLKGRDQQLEAAVKLLLK